MKRLAAALITSIALALPAYGQTLADSAKAAIGTSDIGLYSFGNMLGLGYVDGRSAKPKSVPIAQIEIPHTLANAFIYNGGVSAPVTPSWTSPTSGVTDLSSFSDGVFPVGAEFGSGTVSVLEAAAHALDIPSSSKFYQANATAGYVRNGSTTTSAVGVFGQLTQSAASIGGDAVNGVCGNGPFQTSSVGFDVNGAVSCIESDVNMRLKADSTTPGGNIYGFVAAGGSNTQSTGLTNAYDVHPLGQTQTPYIRWKNGLFSTAGSADVGINLGALLALGSSASSQPIVLHANNASGVDISINAAQLDAAGNLKAQVGAGGAFMVFDKQTTPNNLFTASARQFTVPSTISVGGHSLVKGATPTLSACGTNPSITGTDAAGLILVGAGAKGCTLTYTIPYGTRPFCVPRSEIGANFAYDTSTAFQLILTSVTASDRIDYICQSSS